MIAAMGAITTLGFIVWAHPYNIYYNMGYIDNTIEGVEPLMSSLLFTGECQVRGRTITISLWLNELFVDWFVAFAEGDGGFYYSESGGYKRLFFKIRQKNRDVLDYIYHNFRLGSERLSNDGYYTYTVSARQEILVLYYIFNGRLLTARFPRRV